MPFSSQLLAQIQEFAARFKTALGSLLGKFMEKTEDLRFRLRSGFYSLADRLPEGKQRIVLFGMVGLLGLLLLIFAGMLLSGKDTSEDEKTVAGGASGRVPAALSAQIIPPEELFLPGEPDFVPGVILGREQRAMWTTADAALLWQDPLRNGEEPWRNRIEKTIDEIMESVP